MLCGRSTHIFLKSFEDFDCTIVYNSLRIVNNKGEGNVIPLG
jgi:hypothetical protein